MNITVPLSSYKVTLGRMIEMEYADSYAMIECYGGEYEYFIFFLRPDSFIPQNSYYPHIKRGNAFLPYDLYPMYIDLLRNEKPIKINLNTNKPEWHQLLTGAEPVGEGE